MKYTITIEKNEHRDGKPADDIRVLVFKSYMDIGKIAKLITDIFDRELKARMRNMERVQRWFRDENGKFRDVNLENIDEREGINDNN